MRLLVILLLGSSVFFSTGQEDNISNADSSDLKKKDLLLGNTTYLGLIYNGFSEHETGIELGRSFAFLSPHPVPIWLSSTYGLSARLSTTDWKNHYLLGGFYQATFSWLTFRFEFFQDFLAQKTYFRPGVGMSFFFLDVLYNYSFCFNGTSDYRHALMIKLNLYLPFKRWYRANPYPPSGAYMY